FVSLFLYDFLCINDSNTYESNFLNLLNPFEYFPFLSYNKLGQYTQVVNPTGRELKMKSIKTKISLIMLVLLIVPLAIITYISYINSAILEMAVIQKDDLESVSSEFSDTFDEYETLLDEVSEMPEVELEAYTFPENADMKKYNNMPVVNDPVKTDFYQSLFSDVLEGNSYAMNVYL